jgi:hypothetical protein
MVIKFKSYLSWTHANHSIFCYGFPVKKPDNAQDLQDHNVLQNTFEDELDSFLFRLL